jgi:hypothetical protein
MVNDNVGQFEPFFNVEDSRPMYLILGLVQ